MMQIIFDHCHPESPTVSTFYFRPEKPVDYKAGQYAHFYLDHPNPDSRGIERQFTLSSSPGEDLISITTRIAIDDASSFTQRLRALEPGAKMEMTDPTGVFVLPESKVLPLLFIAGGIGVTPFFSMSKVLRNAESKRVRLLYAVREESEILFSDALRSSYDTAILVDNPSKHWTGLTGRLTSSYILNHEDISPETLIYISGPESMVEDLATSLTLTGIEKSRIIIDAFIGYENI